MEQNAENLTNESQTEASQLNAAVGDKAESVATDSLSLAEINEITGMNYKDKETALKSLKDMKSQAGRVSDLEGKIKEAKANPSTSDEKLALLQEQLHQTQLEVFYSKNPDVNKALAETIAKANSISIQEAVNTDLYKSTVAQPQKRTVADSNSRVAQPAKDDEKPQPGDKRAAAEYVASKFFTKN